MENWFTRTHQTWKFNLFIIVLAIAGILFLLLIWQVNEPRRFTEWGIDNPIIFPLAFVSVGLLSFIWLIFAIRCPQCGQRPAWNILRLSSINNWLMTLSQLDACPDCGDKGGNVEDRRANL